MLRNENLGSPVEEIKQIRMKNIFCQPVEVCFLFQISKEKIYKMLFIKITKENKSTKIFSNRIFQHICYFFIVLSKTGMF